MNECVTSDQIPDEDSRILQTGHDAGVVTGYAERDGVGSGLPLLEESATLQIVNDDEVGIAALQFLRRYKKQQKKD